jgi:hypothetical protein
MKTLSLLASLLTAVYVGPAGADDLDDFLDAAVRQRNIPERRLRPGRP